MSIFSKIVSGEITAYKIAENDNFLAFLDVFPLVKGHILVIPKKETDYIFDIESNEYAELWKFAQSVAKAQKQAIPCKKIGIAVVGLEVPHAHIHLVPINEVGDMNFSKPKIKLTEFEMKEIQEKVISFL